MRLVLCTGPHRSGTSMTAAALQLLGAELRLPDTFSDPDNPRGYFEHWDAVALNDRILAELGSTWDTPTFDGPAALAAGIVGAERKAEWIEQAAGLIRRIGGEASVAAIKDPRICLLAPIWMEAAARAGVASRDLLVLHVYRDPVEVALSLRARAMRASDSYEFGRVLAEGAALWLACTGQLYEATQGHAVTVVSHRALIDAPAATLLRLAGFLGVPVEPERVGAIASSLLDRDLSRSRADDPDREGVLAALSALREMTGLFEEAATLPRIAEAAHGRVCELWNDPGCREAIRRAAVPALGRLNRKVHQHPQEIARLRAEGAEATNRLHAEIARIQEAHEASLARQAREMAERAEADRKIIDSREREAATLRQAIAGLEEERAALLAFKNELLASTSWRVTAPVRALGHLLRRALARGRTGVTPDRASPAGMAGDAQEPHGERSRLLRARFAGRALRTRSAISASEGPRLDLKAGPRLVERGMPGSGPLEAPTMEGLGPRNLVPKAGPARQAAGPDRDDGFAATYLRRLRTLTGSWPGEPIGPDGLLRVLNPTGSKPPLLWCFNGEQEFVQMAAGLGPDQPVVGMRSLNQAAPTGPARFVLGQRLADHYVEVVKAGLSFDRCAVGGNCQSAAIATRMALRLMEAGRQVELLLTLEAAPPVPYPGRVALLFGRESESHNPFLRQERPQDLWRAIHREVSWTIVPGAHGEYFAEANVGPLCAAIRDRLDAARAAPPLVGRPAARLMLPASPVRAPAGSTLAVPVEIRDPRPGGRRSYNVLALWWSETLGAWPRAGEEAAALARIEGPGPADLVVATPDGPGPWQLRLVLCREGEGPLGREDEAPPVLAVGIEEAEAAA